MNRKTILIGYVLITILLNGCSNVSSQYNSPETAPTRSPQEKLDAEAKIIETHLKNFESSIFVLTMHSIPYPGYIQIIILRDNGFVERWIEAPNHAIMNSIRGNLETAEMDFIIDELDAIRLPLSGSSIQDSFILTISINQHPERTISCGKFNCPPEICSIFKLLDNVEHRQHPDIATNITCPLGE